MASFSDLVNVSFQDLTAHQSTDGVDILGVYMPYHWGPVDNLRVYSRNEFYEMYPESLPIGKKLSDASDHYYDAYTQIKKFFENGGSYVEVYRPTLGNKYQGKTQSGYKVMLKYPGSIPSGMLPANTTAVKLNVTGTRISVTATVNSTDVTLESWDGQFTDTMQTQDGRFTHFTKVLESSRFLTCVPETDSRVMTEVTDSFTSVLDSTDVTGMSAADIEKVFSDIENSDATLFISPVTTSEFDTTVVNVAKNAKTLTAIIGYPVTEELNETSITDHFVSVTDKFAVPLAGREYANIFGETQVLNCVGGYCGALSNIASTVRVNQVASAKTYGSYVGTIEGAISFSEVLTLHESGITSIYNSKTGPQIFGVHNASYKQQPNSYFSKTNVTRVLTFVLKSIYPICFEAIHADTAANPISRAVFESRCNSVINDMIAQQNLQPDSYADASAAINTDYLTKGGKELNLILVLHFIGLVERVKIKIIATDSSVNAEIV